MIYDPDKLLLLAGPCSLESLDICRTVADTLKQLEAKHSDLTILFKGSFDKANRTSSKSERGAGIEAGLEIFKAIQEEYGLRTITDIHLPDQCAALGTVVDALQIPAFLCRQTDLLVAAAATGCAINVKKGQFLSPQEMQFVVQKLEDSGKFDKPIVTAITEAPTFYIAEEYHQDFYKKQSARYKIYAEASGRKGFLEETWSED